MKLYHYIWLIILGVVEFINSVITWANYRMTVDSTPDPSLYAFLIFVGFITASMGVSLLISRLNEEEKYSFLKKGRRIDKILNIIYSDLSNERDKTEKEIFQGHIKELVLLMDLTKK